MYRVMETAFLSFEDTKYIFKELHKAEIDYYTTESSTYSLSSAAIWVKTESDHKKARLIICRLDELNKRKSKQKIPQKKKTKYDVVLLLLMLSILITAMIKFYFKFT